MIKGGSAHQAASHPNRWDKSEGSLPSMGKGAAAREQRKTLDLVKVKWKNKLCVDETSVVNLQNEEKKEGRN